VENVRAMKEHSQIDDMRAAIRGDLERSRARRQHDGPRDRVHRVPETDTEPEPAQETPRTGLFSGLFRRR
jgi:hypothetical protein